jgi:hypothetical protein
VLEELTADQRDVVGEVAVGLHGYDDRQAVGAAGSHVLLAERGGLVHQPGAVLGGDVVGQQHQVGCGRALLDRRELHQLEGALVGPALHLRAQQRGLDRPAFAQRAAEQGLGDDERLVAVRGDGVGHVRARGDGGVGHQRPRGRRPDQERCPRRVGSAGVRAGGQREADVDAGIGHGLVPLRHLVVREARPVAGAVRRDPVVLDQQPLAVDLLQGPPDRLDVLGVHRAVGLPHVDPAAHPLGHLLPEVHVALHRLAAVLVELGNAEGLDVGLPGEAELLLDSELDRQAVAVPAALAVDLVALHRAEPGEDVLERARLDVVGARSAVGGRRALVEGPALLARVALDRLLEDPPLAPGGHHLALHGREVDLRGDRTVTSHSCPSSFDFWCSSKPKGRGAAGATPRGTTLLGRPPARRPTSWATRGSTAAGSTP